MFLDPIAAQQRLPVVLLSGFLGSGKTTLINRLLSEPALAGTAVAVNEFGAMPLDPLLIEHGAEASLVLANGCLCCRLAGDFDDAIMRVFTRRSEGALPDFRRLLIEPSGLADPAPIAQSILRNPVLSRLLRLEAIVATVDALGAPEQLARHPETAKQVALADRLVLTKTDLADARQIGTVRAELRRRNPLAPVFTAADGPALLPAGFLDPTAPAERHSALVAEAVAADPAHTESTEAAVLIAETPLRWRPFEAWLRSVRLRPGGAVLRIKGLVSIAGTPGPVLIQGVEHVLHPPVALERWPDDDQRTRLVVISRGLPPGMVAEGWAQALPGMVADGGAAG
jgi:G3E family GTPase